MKTDADVIVVGGGMVGAALACALGEGGLRVVMIEAHAPRAPAPGDDYDLRVSAITQASQRIFMNLGVWDAIAGYRVSPFRQMHVWDAAGAGEIHFDSAEIGVPYLGHIIENRVIRHALWARAQSIDSIDILCPAVPSAVDVADDCAAVVLQDGRRLTASLVVGADGADSRVRAFAGIETRGWSYGQQAIVATVRPERHHGETAWQRFLPEGPLAFLPLADGRCSIVWSTSPEQAERLLGLDDAEFLHELETASDAKLGRMLEAGPRASFPLRMMHADAYVRTRLALIGDAAHTIHPLAGQGANLGFLDAATLAEVLLDAATARRDLGALATLRRYERWRKGDNLLMAAAMEGFKRLFGSRWAVVRGLRNVGLDLTNRAVPVKNLIMRRAMGLEGDLPRAARL